MVVPDGSSEKAGVGDELGSEEDLLYEEFRSSGHRFGHPGGGGGEQLAINEVSNVEMLTPSNNNEYLWIIVRSNETSLK